MGGSAATYLYSCEMACALGPHISLYTHFGEGCGKEVCIRTVCTFALHLVNILSSIQVCSCTQAEGAFSLSVSYAHTMLVGTQPYLFGSGGIRDNLVL